MASLKIQDLPPAERPREKLASRGAAALTDAELLAIFFRTGNQGENAIELGRRLIAERKTLRAIAGCSIEELNQIKGIGPAKASELAAAFELGNRLALERVTQTKIDNPEIVYQLLGGELGPLHQESLRILVLNTRYRLVRIEEITRGSLNESIAHPREILKKVIVHSAHGFILVHNHPSGDPSPSEADRELTRRLDQICRDLQIEFVDHVIIGHPAENREPFFSFKEMGLL